MSRLAALIACGLLLAGCGSAAQERDAKDARPALGLFTTLPLVWGEGDDIGQLIDAPRDPARAAIEQDYELVPLDFLAAEAIAPLGRLLLVQPRVLSPEENVALDEWVRGGGHLALFADPMLTRHTRFPVGDRRRPQDVVILSPILARWGLVLRDTEDEGSRRATMLGQEVVVEHPGQLELAVHEAPADCAIADQGLVARCRIGAGSATIVADAALFNDLAEPAAGASLGAVVAAALGD